MRSFFTLTAAFGLSWLLTLLFVRWSQSREFVAHENHRSMHKGKVPTGGGLPLLAAALATSFVLWPRSDLQSVLAVCLAVLILVSWMDDRNALNPFVRLAVHLAAAGAAVASIPGDALIFQGVLPPLLDRLTAVIALGWFINLYNFMDGIDAIAGVETVFITAGYAAVSYAGAAETAPYHGLAVAILGATLGFLVWNWTPARIFLGDVGSVPLGFLTGAMMLDLAVRHSLAAALILTLYFVSDATITLVRRLLEGAKPWEAHRTHFYQRAALGFGSHTRVVKRIFVCNSVLVIAAVLALTAPYLAIALAIVTVGFLLTHLEIAAKANTPRTQT